MFPKPVCRSSAGRALLTLFLISFVAAGSAPDRAAAQQAENKSLNPQPASPPATQSARRKAASKPSAPIASCVDCLAITLKKSESIGALAREYYDRTFYLMLPELEAAIRQTNGLKAPVFRAGQNLLIPGMLKAPIVEHPVPVPQDFEARGIYLTGWVAGSEHGLELIRRWREAGGNTVVFDVKDMAGVVHVPFHDPLAPGSPNPSLRSLRKFVHFLHSLQLHAVARIALFYDVQLATAYPDLDPVSMKTGGVWKENGKQVWVDPSLAKVQDFNLQLAKYVAESGVDEIQFDYARFPAEGDQKDALFAFMKDQSKEQRSDVITGFLKRAYTELHPMGVLVSVDVFGVMAWQRAKDLSHTGQDIPQLAHYCDVISPMVYPSHFFGMDNIAVPGDAPEHFISESMDRFREITAGTGVVLRPWLQAFGWHTPDYSPAYIILQVNAERQAGGIGFLFWNARNDYGKVFPAMATMRAAGKQYFRGDEIGSATPKSRPSPAASRESSSAPASRSGSLR